MRNMVEGAPPVSPLPTKTVPRSQTHRAPRVGRRPLPRFRRSPSPALRAGEDRSGVVTLFVVQARGTDAVALEKAHFIADRFSWGAFVFGWLWLLYRQLWLAFAVWAALEIAFIFLVLPHVAYATALLCDLLAHLFIGFEGSRMRQDRGARRAGLTDLVEARDRDAAEVTFYERHAPGTAPPETPNETWA